MRTRRFTCSRSFPSAAVRGGVVLLLLLPLFSCGCAFCLHRATTETVVEPVVCAEASGIAPQGLNPATVQALLKLPLVELFTSKAVHLKGIDAAIAARVPVKTTTRRTHEWFVVETQRGTDAGKVFGDQAPVPEPGSN